MMCHTLVDTILDVGGFVALLLVIAFMVVMEHYDWGG